MIKAKGMAMGRLIWIIWVGPIYFRVLKKAKEEDRRVGQRKAMAKTVDEI